MKTYFRLLSFAKPIEKFAIPYVITTLFAIFFNTFLFTLLGPLMQALFLGKCDPAKIAEEKSDWDLLGRFNNYIDGIIAEDKILALKVICVVIIGTVFLANFFRYFSQRFMEDLRVHTLLNIRKTVFNNVMNLHVGYFNNERKGDIISKVASDVQVVQFTVTNTLQVVFKEPLQLLFFIGVLISISVKLTLFSLLVIPVSGFIISKIVKRLKQQATQSHESFAKMIGFLDESLSGIKIIKAFNSTERTKEKFDTENRFYSFLNRKMARRQQLASPVSQTLGVLVVVFILLYGGTLILSGEGDLKAAEFVVYLATFSQVLQPVKALADSFSGIHSGIAAGERVLDLIDTEPALKNKAGAETLGDFSTALTLKDVSFNYGDKEVLKNINIDIEKGKTVALVGPSGGGKSTLMDLLPRFHDPKSGVIKIDGHDYRDLTVESIRSQMGIVNQESFLFNDTIFNNIAFAKPDATEEEVMAAAKIANAHDFILNTENGYQTNVGDRGNKLSGGQKQRVCIARAVLANPPIMLLDEATSALDTESEKLVQDALNNLMKNRTSIVIAHRLSTIQHADKIVVIDKGEVVENGSHNELMNKNGLYRRLIDMQAFND
ncbi:ABC transporter ATP-binding protein [Pedobacter zeae]|uniref:Antibiotic ABC transporter ATP-binding protein n=1 Tax=Pedobacter zeae TaxID=1737356 RepID=A0A7W6P6S8_9SPHI|nr:ABC transporter ATP-binding protein [Pedobacter zeae]MBB4109193.1 subfamily B ATP-binding cassette protein MsbA [Pedobacter zeae]GGH10845.1 antibiotic ABC transporter ATP-binding protein [Pedobacter zeae]